jgi:hypothetical protein
MPARASSLNELIENNNPVWRDTITSGKIADMQLSWHKELGSVT